MAFKEKEMEDQLLEAGNKLVDPPSSVEELLPILDRLESCLSRVEQAPSNSMLIALSPSLKALVGDKLLRHSDPDVKVVLASCFSELTRITAPEAPYDDNQMKEIFQLVVSSFENIHDRLSRSYSKRKAILETVAKVRSCVLMLDLECDALILKMFEHFIKGIREHHSGKVFSSMEIIMTLVLEESEDISYDLLSPLLGSIKKDNEDVIPVARKLGERVLERCATKLKPYLVQAVRTLGISVDDYSKVLASICQETSENLEKKGVHVTGEHMEDKGKSTKLSPEESTQVVNDGAEEAAHSSQDNRDRNRTTKSVRNNGVAYVAEDDALGDAKSIKKKEDTNSSGHSKGLRISGHVELNNLEVGKADKNELKPKQDTKKSRRKSSYSTKSAKPSECQVVASEKKSEKMMDSESHIKEVLSSPHEDKFVEKKEEIRAKISLPKACNDESEVVAAPSPSDNLPDENHLKKLGKAKSKDSPANVEGTEASSKKVPEGASISEAKPVKRSVRVVLGRSSGVKNTAEIDSSKKQSGADAKKHSAKKMDDNEGGSTSSRQLVDKKKSGRGEANSGTVAAKSSTLDVDKEMVSSPTSAAKSSEEEKLEETTRRSSKRKHASGRKNESENKGCDEKLVGVRVEVWWPKDRQYYKGVIESFDSAKKKHKVLYDDGEVEVLNLLKERYNIIKADSVPDGEEGNDHARLDASTEMPPRKKVKKSAGEQPKEGKLGQGLFSSGGATGSSKSKGVSMKSGQKSKDVNKSKESKTISESEDEGSRELNDSTLKSGSSKSAAQKMTSSSKTSLSKEEKNTITPKLSVKSKQETPRGGTSKHKTPKIAASEGKPLKSSGKSTADGGGKVKSVTLKKNDDSDVSASEEEDTKGKKPVSSKTAASEGKPPKSVGKFTADSGGNVKSFSLKKKDLENDDSDVSASEAEDTKGKTSVSSKTSASEGKPRNSVGKSTTDGGGKVKSVSLKKKDLENDDTDVSESEAEDTKGKTSVSSKIAASEGKPPKSGRKSTADGGGRVISFSLKKKDLENEDSDISASEKEDAKGKAPVSSKAQGSEAKRGKKRQRS